MTTEAKAAPYTPEIPIEKRLDLARGTIRRQKGEIDDLKDQVRQLEEKLGFARDGLELLRKRGETSERRLENAAAQRDRAWKAIDDARQEAEEKAWKALGGYKFLMFGYWAACWVHANRMAKAARPAAAKASPFADLVKEARRRIGK